MQIPDSEDLISLEHAARLCGINRETLRYHLARHANAPTVEIANHTYIFRSKLAAWNKERMKLMHRRINARKA